MPDRYLRKGNLGQRFDNNFQNPAILCLLRVMFGLPDETDRAILDEAQIEWVGPEYSVKEFAAHVGIGQFAIYKWLAQAAHFPVQYLPEFVAFVNIKSNGADMRLIHYFADLSGYGAKVRQIEKIIGRSA